MSPPEIWGPSVWRLFHTLSEKINENAYNALSPQLFNFFVRICKFLPCPYCSTDASNFLAKIKPSNIKNKFEFKNTFYLFHNWVNAKKKKPLFNYANINNYGKYKIFDVMNDFITKYQTKGNMNLLTDTFQRQLIIKDLKKWVSYTINAFLPVINVPKQLLKINNEPIIYEEIIVTNDAAVVTEEIIVTNDATVVTEEIIITNDVEVVTEEIIVTYDTAVVTEEIIVTNDTNAIIGANEIIVTYDVAVVEPVIE
jgi:hypothetical protein